MSNRLGRLRGMAYPGTDADQPPNWTFNDRDPTPNDTNHSLGDLWLNEINNSAWVLVSLAGNSVSRGMRALWIKWANALGFLIGLEASDFTLAFGNVNGIIEFPDQVIAGSGTIDSNLFSNVDPNFGNELTFNLKPAIRLPITNAAGTEGVIYLGTERFMHAYGTSNTFLGEDAGNFTLTTGSSVGSTCIGFNSGASLTTARGSTFIGRDAGFSCTSGIDCVAVGDQALEDFTSGAADAGANTALGTLAGRRLQTGSHNLFLGDSAGRLLISGDVNTIIGTQCGLAYTTNESRNVLIQSVGVVLDNNTCRIGNATGVGDLELNRTFVQGIRGIVPDVDDGLPVVASSEGQLTTGSGFYQTNTWVPSLQFGGAAVGLTYAGRGGVYTKIGNYVFVSCYLQVSNKGISVGAATVTGLPFAVSAATMLYAAQIATGQGIILTAGYASIHARYNASTTTIILEQDDLATGGSYVVLTDVNFAAATDFFITGSYLVD